MPRALKVTLKSSMISHLSYLLHLQAVLHHLQVYSQEKKGAIARQQQRPSQKAHKLLQGVPIKAIARHQALAIRVVVVAVTLLKAT